MTISNEIIVDNFAGGGGASTGIELATGRVVDIAVNHDPDAILMHKTNHPRTKHYQASVWDIDPKEVCNGQRVGLAWFSPDCKHFSKAKGGKPVDRNIRGLAWIVLRWAGTVRPRVIILENVEEFQTWGPVRRGRPVKSKAGQTFRRFISQLEALGYAVEWRELIAADYGAPTIRKRFFMVARCDGRPIIWPEPTHAPADGLEVMAGLKKAWRGAVEIIDWSLPCPSIFDSKEEIVERYGLKAQRPLRPNTLRRVARGLDKFVLKEAKPFLVVTNHSGEQFRGQDLVSPLSTVTGKHGYGVVSPALIQYHTEQSDYVRGQAIDRPILTVDAANRYGLIAPVLSKYYGTATGQRVRDPLHTVTAKDRESLMVPYLELFHNGGYHGKGNTPADPLNTVTASGGQCLNVAHIAKFKGPDIGHHAATPLHTVTAGGGTFALVRTTIQKPDAGADLRRWPQVRELLNTYCGYTLEDDEILLLWFGGAAYYIVDIGLRMLTPRELYRANGFPDDYKIERDYTGAVYGKSKQVARCGNAVPPPFATALVAANLPEWCEKRYRTMAEFRAAVTA